MAAMAAATVVRFTDFAMVGSLGPSALAGVGVGGQFYWLLESIGAIAPAGLTAVLARAVGRGDSESADRSFRQAQILGGGLALFGSALLLPLTTHAIALYGVEPDVIALGSDYLWWRIWGTLPLSIAMVFGAGLRAAGDVKTPLGVSVVGALVNVFLNWVLIHGNLGAPTLGVVGAAIASDIALITMAGLFWGLWKTRRLVLSPTGARWRPDPPVLRRLGRIGTPAGAESGFFQAGLLAFQRLMSPFGTNVIAAYNIGTTILSFSFIPGIGFSMAAATLVGQQLGARSPERASSAGWRSTIAAMATMSGVGALLVVGARPIAEAFTADPAVVALTITILWILALAHPFMAVEFAIGGSLRGAGDTLFPMLTVFSGLIVVRIGLAVALVTWFEAGIQLVWSTLVADYVLKSAMLISRFRSDTWQRRRI